MVTHIDHPSKLMRLMQLSRNTDKFICMSLSMLTELSRTLLVTKLAMVHPAGNDYIVPRKLHLGIFSKVHSDGRKRENYILDLLPAISPQVFDFYIMGNGWEPYLEAFERFGFGVSWEKGFNQEVYAQWMTSIDYFLYFGWDEGSMAWIDAIRAGVKTIVTPQGYHNDIPQGITYPIKDSSELVRVLLEIQEERKTYVHQVHNWTWQQYSADHRNVWSKILMDKERRWGK